VLDEKRFSWVKDIVDWQESASATDAYLDSLETMKIDVFQDRIFVFTPKGDVIDLPDGATPVDFAYAIHTQIGNTCCGARVNDRIVGLDTPLTSGDFCEIITDKNRKAPNPDWLKFVKTRHAKSAIRTISKSKLTKWLKEMSSQDGKDDEKDKDGSA